MNSELERHWSEIRTLRDKGLGLASIRFYLKQVHDVSVEDSELRKFEAFLDKVLKPAEVSNATVEFDEATLAVLHIYQAEHDISLHPLSEFAGLAQKIVAAGGDAEEVRAAIVEASGVKKPIAQVNTLVDRLEMVVTMKATFKNAETKLKLAG